MTPEKIAASQLSNDNGPKSSYELEDPIQNTESETDQGSNS